MDVCEEKQAKCTSIVKDAIFDLIQLGHTGGEKAVALTAALDQKEVLSFLTKILVEYASLQDDYDEQKRKNADLTDQLTEHNRNLNLSVLSLDVPIRTKNAFVSANIKYVGELVRKSEKEVLEIPNLGMKSLSEIKNALLTKGLELDLKLTGWEPPIRRRL